MKHLALGLLCLVLSATAFAQSVTVSGTVTDAKSQTWNNGSIQFTFIPVSNYVGPYAWTGGAFNPSNAIAGTMNSSGAYSVSVPGNDAITPVGSSWAIRVCPQGSGACFTDTVILSGATQTKNVTPPAICVTPGANISLYASAEVCGGQLGSQFYLIGTGLEVCSAVTSGSCSTWSAVGGAGGGVTSVATTSPLTGGPITTTGTIACATCTVTVAHGTQALGTSAITNNTCATIITTAATGVATTDNLMADFNADPTGVTGYNPSGGLLTIIKFPSSNNVNFYVCNKSGADITPGAISLNWRVVR